MSRMFYRPNRYTPPLQRADRRLLRVAASLLLGAALSTIVDARPAHGQPDTFDRSMDFVEKSVAATELYNQRRLPEALVAFEELLRDYGDLDEDGFVGMSLADCLLGLGRHQEARTMYKSIESAHPGLAELVQQRLWEASLAGEPDDAVLEELRTASAAEGEAAYVARVQLGRALQKRAVSLLSEAMNTFRAAVATEPTLAQPTRRLIAGQAEMLAEIQEDLSSLIQRLDRAWAAVNTLGEPCETTSDTDERQIGQFHSTWTVVREAVPVHLEVSWDEASAIKAFADRQVVQLNRTQSLLIRRHQERINAILLEAMQSGSEDPQTGKPADKPADAPAGK